MKKLITLSMLICMLSACDKSDYAERVDTKPTTRSGVMDLTLCGETTTTRFMAGQHYEAGQVTVGNDDEFIYIIVNTQDEWVMKKIHIFAGIENKFASLKNPTAPGQYPYKESFKPYTTNYTLMIPKSDIEEKCFIIAVHAEVVKIDESGREYGGETAWGEGSRIKEQGPWAMKFEYCMQECEEEQPPHEIKYQEETAWGNGIKYGGNWAMYTPYQTTEPIKLIAGNPKNKETVAGWITFSEVINGKVTISIEMINGWELQPINESVKIEGSDKNLSGNPAPGQFPYKGQSLVIEVDEYAYYGIHLDVRKEI